MLRDSQAAIATAHLGEAARFRAFAETLEPPPEAGDG